MTDDTLDALMVAALISADRMPENVDQAAVTLLQCDFAPSIIARRLFEVYEIAQTLLTVENPSYRTAALGQN